MRLRKLKMREYEKFNSSYARSDIIATPFLVMWRICPPLLHPPN